MQVFVLEALQGYLEVVRQDGDQVDGVQHTASKTLEVGGGHQAQQVLQGEEGDAECLHVLAIESAAGLARRRLEEKIIVNNKKCYYSILASMLRGIIHTKHDNVLTRNSAHFLGTPPIVVATAPACLSGECGGN